MLKHDVPEEIKEKILDEVHEVDQVGRSESEVILFEGQVLKIQLSNRESANEYQVMKWLEGKLQVPKVQAYVQELEQDFMLMSKLEGRMACDDLYMRNPELLTEILAEGLKALWSINIEDFSFGLDLDRKLENAKVAVAKNRIDTEDAEPDTYGENGFKDPADLLEWLVANKPEEDLVFSHGDFCLPNIFIKENKISGYIDLGRSGKGDKWQDIALCYRSLVHNYDGKYGGTPYEGFSPEMLFEKLGIEPDWHKIRYYILLDELF